MSSKLLLATLSACAALLRQVDETFWSEKIERITARGSALYVNDAEKILCWFGGMGSFNDLMIMAINEHNISEKDEPEINRKLNEMRQIIYEEAKKICKA